MSAASIAPRPRPASPSTRLDLDTARSILREAAAAGRSSLLEPEGLALLRAAGIRTPTSMFLPLGTGDELDAIATAGLGTGPVPGTAGGHVAERVVVKVVAEEIVHKTEAGGVAFVAAKPAAIRSAIDAMREQLEGQAELRGFLVSELVAHDPGLAGELLVTLRWTPDFGPIVAVGAGGIHAELLAHDLRPGRELAIVSTASTEPREIAAALRAATVVRLATEPQRGRAPLLPMPALVDTVSRLHELGRRCMPGELLELELNPMAVSDGELVALDVLVRLATSQATAPRPARPADAIRRIDRLLAPRSIAIVGVSSGENIGRTILRNILRDGFDPAAITIVKPGASQIDGCRCVPDLASLAGPVADPVDLLIVAVAASAATELVCDAIERDAAESIIVIPGGFEETAAGAGHATRIREALDRARQRPHGGPVINGANCMGVRSGPGRYDTLFIPDAKLAAPTGRPAAPLAIVAQSGAFAISRLSRLEGIDPRYVITVGNQLDLTIGDHLEHLVPDPEVRVVGVYVEGFAPLDGLRFLRAARAIADRGGVVILYRGGRTPAGASASASHTAAIAGDAVVTSALARSAGVVVAETLEDFDDLVSTFVRLDGRRPAGTRLGAVTNAGFECVAIGDSGGGLRIGPFDDATTATLAGILEHRGLAGVIEVHNPVDLTPMADDATFADVANAVLDSPSVDIGLIGNVPFTIVMRTLPSEGLEEPGSVAARLIALWRRSTKPWVAVVDAGPRYDPLVRTLAAAGIPTFRTADAAMRTLASVVAHLGPRV
ncbi:MAG: acetate--CoA ligase family protein [Chloroflexi bacterium]|nr:acetate--CoA ligase family protein [Chloroflexota bacterium]